MIILIAFILNLQALELDYTLSSNFNSTFRKKIEKSLDMLEQALNEEALWDEFIKIEKLECLEAPFKDAQDVVNFLRNKKVTFYMKSFYKPFSATNAVRKGKTVRLNSWKTKRSSLAWANTIFHEALHVAGFGHCGKNDRSRYPQITNAVPYRFGDILEEYLQED
jgi:plasmid maintenance system killer protein